MNVLVWLAAILFLLMVLIGGSKGARSFIALFFNFGVIFMTILFMTDPNANPIILTLIASTIISCITLFFINNVNNKTITAFISTIITITILIFFIVIVTDDAMIQGFSEEETRGDKHVFALYWSRFCENRGFNDHHEYNWCHNGYCHFYCISHA